MSVRLAGTLARIADAGATGSNSALTGLSEIDGSLGLFNGDSAVLGGNLAVTGFLGLDSDGYSGEGGSSLSVAGTLTNTGQIILGPFTGGLSAATSLSVGGLAGTGSLQIHGSTAATGPPQAEVDVLSVAPGVLGGTTRLDGNALLRYASGSIGTVASGVTLTLYGPLARIADAAATDSNSALSGLSETTGRSGCSTATARRSAATSPSPGSSGSTATATAARAGRASASRGP